MSADEAQKQTAAESAERESAERTPEEIEADIRETREDLADTVAALAEKADVKAQARKKVDETKANAKERIAGVAGSAKAKAQEATPGSAQEAARQGAETAQQTVRENPVPAAAVGALLVGFLLGWLIARRS